jgi:RNA polymerase sigma factor (sigma-70 family)
VLPHEQALLSAARRLSGDAERARDLVQDSFARLFTVENWAAITAPRAYVMRMMRNQMVEQARCARKVWFEQLTVIDTFDVADDAPGAFRVTSAREEIRRIKDAMRTLPERCRDVAAYGHAVAARTGVGPSRARWWPRRVDVRIISATHRDLEGAIIDGGFREESWASKTEQFDKWSICPMATSMVANMRHDEQETSPEPQPGLQGKSSMAALKGEEMLADLSQ